MPRESGEHTNTTPADDASPPFDRSKLDGLMEAGGVDILLATSRHNNRYLLGGYRFFLYDVEDSIGLSRYLPVVGYVRGRPDAAFYVGAGTEHWGTEVEHLWVPQVENVAYSTTDAAERAAAAVSSRVNGSPTIAVEFPYLAADAMDHLRLWLPEATFVDATPMLEELRAIKTATELDTIREVSEKVVASMLAAFEDSKAGESKHDIAERLRREETERGLTFAYCVIAMGGHSYNRAPSHDQRWAEGEILSLDSGGTQAGYLGDLTRMGVLGTPTSEMQQLLDEISAVQAAARRPIRPGVRGGEIFEVALEELRGCAHADQMVFQAHGTGMVGHEVPRLTDTGDPPYPADHRDRPLEAGMVLSIETTARSPEVGFVKLEDVVFVTEDGSQGVADEGRGWNVASG
jgi:Xaa-Pro aminopeptidase